MFKRLLFAGSVACEVSVTIDGRDGRKGKETYFKSTSIRALIYEEEPIVLGNEVASKIDGEEFIAFGNEVFSTRRQRKIIPSKFTKPSNSRESFFRRVELQVVIIFQK